MAKSRKLLDKRIIKLQAEAYYQAMKKYNAECELKEEEKESDNESVWNKILFGLNVFLCPWKISKKFKINTKIYDDILVLIIASIFMISGTLLWGAGILMAILVIAQLIQRLISFHVMMVSLGITVLMMGFGCIFIIAGKEFSKVTDSNKIYAYSASVLAVVSCIVAILSLFK